MSEYFDSYRILFSYEPMVLLVHSGSVLISHLPLEQIHVHCVFYL
jgi:branched-subunit amino acid permease